MLTASGQHASLALLGFALSLTPDCRLCPKLRLQTSHHCPEAISRTWQAEATGAVGRASSVRAAVLGITASAVEIEGRVLLVVTIVVVKGVIVVGGIGIVVVVVVRTARPDVGT